MRELGLRQVSYFSQNMKKTGKNAGLTNMIFKSKIIFLKKLVYQPPLNRSQMVVIFEMDKRKVVPKNIF